MKNVMKAISARLFLVTAMVCMSFSVVAFSQDVAPVPSPEVFQQFLAFISTIPKFGPIITMIIYWIGAIAAFFTALTVCVITILKIPQVALRFKGASDLADKIEAFSKKVSYYLKYASIFNAKKQ